jgi:isopenicillin N synthase-like dioxygenase
MSVSAGPTRHAAFRELPRVSIAGLRAPHAEERKAAALVLVQAARDAGFLYVVDHGVDERTCDALVDVAARYFAEPDEFKLQHYIGRSKLAHRGYVPEGEEIFYGGSRDRKEAFDLSFELPATDPDVLLNTPMMGPNVWPELPGFRERVSAYYLGVFELGRTLLRGFSLGLGLTEHFFDDVVKKPPSQLRLIHYPESGDDCSGGIAAHTDYEMFTILLATSPGLEVVNGAGEWIDAPPLPGAFVVNIGDMLEIMTNGELSATSHRVRRVASDRYSFPLFFSCDYHTVVAPLPAFVTGQRPSRYDSLIAGEHLFAQTVQSFAYLKERLARGELELPRNARPLGSFAKADAGARSPST